MQQIFFPTSQGGKTLFSNPQYFDTRSRIINGCFFLSLSLSLSSSFSSHSLSSLLTHYFYLYFFLTSVIPHNDRSMYPYKLIACGLIYEQSFNRGSFFTIDFELFIIIYVCRSAFRDNGFQRWCQETWKRGERKKERERERERKIVRRRDRQWYKVGKQSTFNHRTRLWPIYVQHRHGEQRQSSFDSRPLRRRWNAVIIHASTPISA